MAIALLVLFLIAYLLVGIIFGFNLWRSAERAASHFKTYPWLLRQVGKDNPQVWRGGGLIMLSFGLIVLLWLAIQSTWALPTIPASSGAVMLAGIGLVAIAAIVWLIVQRLRR